MAQHDPEDPAGASPPAQPAEHGTGRDPEVEPHQELARAVDPEHAANRPYRRLVGAIFAIAVVALCGGLIRGVVRALDRMPSAATLERPQIVDTRALRACADDLERLELKIRQSAAKAFGEAPAPDDGWSTARDAHELERITIVARCRLDEPTEDPAVHDLERAAESLEGLLRAYNLLHARHVDDGMMQSAATRAALERAAHALKSR